MGRLRNYFTYISTGILTTCLFLLPVIAEAGVIESTAQELMWNVLITITGTFLRVAGILFDYGVNTFVIGFGDLYQNSGVGFAVDNTWVTIRDFVNLFFIFGLVYIGFKMILGNDSSNTRRWLINIIIAALLINFSLFITKFVVDFSNQLSYQIAKSAFTTSGELPLSKDGTKPKLNVSTQIITMMGMRDIFDLSANGLPNASWGYIFGTAIFFMITAFVLAAGGFLLIIRFAMLNLFMVLSPLMFMSWILPPLSDTMNRYWKEFIKRAFFAPIYFLFMYFSLEILKGFQSYIKAGTTGNGLQSAGSNMANTLAGTGGKQVLESTESTMPFFFLMCIFMMASLVIAQKLGAEGAGQAVSLGKNLSNRAGKFTKGAAIGTGRFAAAQTVGRGARWGSEAAGSGLNAGLRRVQQLQGDGAVTKFVRGAARMNAVQGTVGGVADSMQKAKFGLSRTREEERRMKQQTNSRANDATALTVGLAAQARLDGVRTGKIKDRHGVEHDIEGMTGQMKKELGIEGLKSTDTAVREKAEKEHEAQAAKMQQIAADMGIKDFEALSDSEQVKIAPHLNGSFADKIEKSDAISDEQKKAITDKQKKAITDVIIENKQVLTEKLANLSTRQIEMLGDEFIANNAALFTDSQFADLKKSKKFTESQTGRFITNRKADTLKRVEDGGASADSIFRVGTGTVATTDAAGKVTHSVNHTKDKKASEIAKLSGEVLRKENAVKFITVDVLKAIASGDKEFERVSTSDREKILDNLSRENTTESIKALNWLRSAKGQESFLGQEPSQQAPTPPAPATPKERFFDRRNARP